jgi:hypothetical protein
VAALRQAHPSAARRRRALLRPHRAVARRRHPPLQDRQGPSKSPSRRPPRRCGHDTLTTHPGACPVDQWWIRSSAVAGVLRPVVTGRAGRRGGGAAPHFGQVGAFLDRLVLSAGRLHRRRTRGRHDPPDTT